MDSIEIIGIKWYVDIEYKGSIAGFDGEMCADGFYATASSLSQGKSMHVIFPN